MLLIEITENETDDVISPNYNVVQSISPQLSIL